MSGMSAPLLSRRLVAVPAVPPPPPFVERRRRFRREADRLEHEETRLLARALDVLAAGGGPEARLAGLLDLLAETVGAVRAAVVADRPDRRVAVADSDGTDHAEAIALATWLDAAAPRSRARRAAAGPAPISVAVRANGATHPAPTAGHYACLPIPSAGDVTLGFAFTAPVEPDAVARRLPPALARHAAVALTLVTDALTTERELHVLRAQEAESARFVSNVAHELRTPLTGLSGYLDLILDDRVGDAEVQRDFLEQGRMIVASMDALVGDLLELSKLESGSLNLEIEPFSVADALGTVASSLHPIALAKGVPMHTDAPPRLLAATGDRRRVEQILTNLAANALKFSTEGSAIELTGRFQGQVAVLAIRDEGPGIALDDRALIFERFYRMADHARVTGTGLGLPIARDLARAMGGELEVASLPGTGSSFILVLPGPAGPIGAAGLAQAVVEALDFELDRLHTVAALRAGSAMAKSALAGTERNGTSAP
jgi:signal transduction histidine kinase